MPIINAHLHSYPNKIINALARQAQCFKMPIYFAGGPVRDWLMDGKPTDLDITIPTNSIAFAKALADDIQGTFVLLSAQEGVARVVSGQLWLDISSFRDGATNIEDDLQKRDFTCNALAVSLDINTKRLDGRIIDPTNGLRDIKNGVVRMVSNEAFRQDPLRLLRAFRFTACLKFRMADKTKDAIKAQAPLLRNSAGERIACELDKIMASNVAGLTIGEMAASGLLWQVFPELLLGVGMVQPASHHLDVFEHGLEALRQFEKIINDPGSMFPGYLPEITTYLGKKRKLIRLKYAALLHDIGKPSSFAMKNGKHTFYNHDQVGAHQIKDIAQRLHWSIADQREVSLLIKHHMRPFHLLNALLRNKVTSRAYLKLIKAVDGELIGLFLLSMSDSLAGCGPGKPRGMEESLAALFDEIYQKNINVFQPILGKPLQLNGKDLISLGQKPGPMFSKCLEEFEMQQIANPLISKAEARRWAAEFFSNLK